MRPPIKAIQTRYSGYRFRSRLEARWACYFDAIGIKWEYEKEGYDLSGSTDWIGPEVLGRYLPDFWLPEEQCWVEIKGCLPQDHFFFTSEESHLHALIAHTNALCGFVFYGLPDYDTKHTVFYWDSGTLEAHRREGLDMLGAHADELVDQAIANARSARFEHGQSGPQ